jgi:Xaa-Pro aminopeptidase
MNFRDNRYHFRQDSRFLYFFDIDSLGLQGIISIDKNNETPFGNGLTIEQMVWTGYLEKRTAQAEKQASPW